MRKPSVGLVSDLAWSEGIGRYGVQLQQLLTDEFELTRVYLDYAKRCVVVASREGEKPVARTAKIPGFDSKPWFWLRVRRAIPEFDIVHLISQNLSFLTPRDGRAVVTCHDIAPLFIPGRPWHRWARRRLYSGLPRAAAVIADSAATASDVSRVFGRDRSSIDVIPLGVDLSLFRPRDKAECRRRLELDGKHRLLLHVGIDKWRKNVAGVLRALVLLASRVPDVQLVRLGGMSPANARLAAELGVGNRVILRPFCDDEQLVDYYCAADCFVFPSFCEGFGLPPLEAMACGTPVVVANVSSLPEVVGGAGLQVDPDSPERISAAVEGVLTDAKLARRLSAEGQARAQEFSWTRTAEATRQVYRRFLEQHRRI
ncbi:MAG: glycosyltransferase family 1 protein [candidate division WOR-3 bacterium]